MRIDQKRNLAVEISHHIHTQRMIHGGPMVMFFSCLTPAGLPKICLAEENEADEAPWAPCHFRNSVSAYRSLLVNSKRKDKFRNVMKFSLH